MVSDAITSIFGAYGRVLPPDVTDLSLGLLREIPLLNRLWADAVSQPIDLRSISSYPGTQGSIRFRTAVARLFFTDVRMQIDPDMVVATHGAYDGIASIASTTAVGTHVLYPMPGFDLAPAVLRAGRTPHPVNWPVDAPISDLLTALTGEIGRLRGSFAVVLAFPSNPAGSDCSENEWRSLHDVVAENGGLLVVDDVYGFLSETRPSFLYTSDTTVIVDSTSKRLGAPGLRVGWTLSGSQLTARIRAAIASQSVGVSGVSLELAAVGLELFVERELRWVVKAELERRRSVLHREIRTAPRGCICRPNSLYACLFTPDNIHGGHFARVLSARGLIVTPGEAMSGGFPTRSFVRLCLGGASDMRHAASLIADTFRDTSLSW